jgi:hypothetical protein
MAAQQAVQQSAVRRRVLAVLSAAVLVAALVQGWSVPAGAHASKGRLAVTGVTDSGSSLGAPVQDRPFDVVVQVQDEKGSPLAVRKATTLVIDKVAGDGSLDGVKTVVVPKGRSTATLTDLTYSPFGNGVELRVRAVSGDPLTATTVTFDVALSAISRGANPRVATSLSDPACPAPTAEVPTCGYLELPNGAQGPVTLALNSCEGVADCRQGPDGTTGLVVLALADLKDDTDQPLYGPTQPATLVVACDKVLCGRTGVTKIPLLVDLTNTGPLEEAPPCPRKGRLGPGQQACVDYVQSRRDRAGDLYTYLLFDYDARASHP